MNLHCTAFLRILIAAAIMVLSGCSDLKKAEKEIEAVSAKFISDKRTEIFRINALKAAEGSLVLEGETTLPQAKSALINALSEKQIALKDSILILPDTITNERFLGLVTLSVINLRKETDHAAELVSQAVMGTPVEILKSNGSWLLIRTPDRYISWTERSSVRPVNSREMNEWKTSERMIFVDNTGWIYSNTDGSNVVSDLVAGCIMARTGDTGDHIRVMLPDGREGFVRNVSLASFNIFIQPEPTLEGIMKRAASLTGIPYLWGGSSAKGVDCSGFVQTVFFMNGLVVARDASQQALYGKPVDISGSFSNLQPGDLLFFGSPERISHVAIYSGGGEYIHSSGRVMVNSLDSTKANYSRYRRSSLVKAARFVGASGQGIVPLNKHPWY